MSVLLFPPRGLEVAGWMTALGAVAVAEVVEEAEAGSCATIKWPNDVRVGGEKLAGVLVERRQGWVVGIGVNVNALADDFPPTLRETATSMRLAARTELDRSAVARRLIEKLDEHYALGVEQGLAPLEECWRRRLEWLGQ